VDLLSRYRFLLPSAVRNGGKNIKNTKTTEAVKVGMKAEKVQPAREGFKSSHKGKGQ
jgi:hypothetical protein